MLHSILEEIRALDLGRRALRNFGLLVGLVALVLAGVSVWMRAGAIGTTAGVLMGVGSVLVVLGLAAPSLLRPAYLVWMGLAFVLGFVMTRVLLTLVYFGIMTPIALLFRLIGKDPLQRRIDPAAGSYWIPKTYDAPPRERLERYF